MKTRKLMIFLILGFGLIAALSACSEKATPSPQPVETVDLAFVVAEGHVVPSRDLRLHFSTRGRVNEILVEEGEQVREGQALMRLGDREGAQAALQGAQLELKNAQQALDDFLRQGDLATAQSWQDYLQAQIRRAEAERVWEDLDLDELEDDIDEARGEVKEREQDLEDAQDDFEIYEDLEEENSDRQAAEDDLEEAQEDLNEAQRDLEEARRAIDLPRAELDAALAAEEEARRVYELNLENGHDPEQRAILENRVSAAEAQVEAAQSSLEDYDLTAPFAGTVTDVYVEVGQAVGPEAPGGQMADLSQFVIETSDLTELEVVRIDEGQAVEIVPDALPETTLMGTVEEISQSFTTQAGDILYTVTIRMEESDPALRWGMTVELTFLTD